MIRGLASLAALALVSLPMALPAEAFESPPVVTKRSTASLVMIGDASAPTQIRVGLRLRMAPGWHTYWRNPGEAGVAPELAFSLGDGAAAGPIAWPVPAVQHEGPIVTYGYETEVLLPVTVTLPPGRTGPIGEMRANWLICKDICVPEEANFPIPAPPSASAAAEAALFAAHDAAMPRMSPWKTVIGTAGGTAGEAAEGMLVMEGTGIDPDVVLAVRFIPDSQGQIDDGAPQTLIKRPEGVALKLTLAKDRAMDRGLSGLWLVTDRTGATTGLTIDARPGAVPPMPAAGAPVSTWAAVVFAFLGGLILNLMPCVFPVLALKAVAFAAGAHRERSWSHGLPYAAGTMLSFVSVAVALLMARSAGMTAGWGFQFASPVFLMIMVWVLFLVGLNLSGVFEASGAFAGAGQSLAARGGAWGSFFTGVLAVLVATPCTAPFMTVAIATGLAAAPWLTVLVFLSMGFGLAAPYLALTLIPSAARLLPRPGRWMELFRQALAFPMYGAAVWLLWVLSQERGAEGVLAAGTGAVLLGFAAWCLGLAQHAGGRGRRIGLLVATVAAVLCVPLLMGLNAKPAQAEAGVEAFSTDRLAALRAAGRPVFVNLTAAWCVTCLVNERVAIATAPVRRAFAARDVVYMKGDWTSQDPAITAFLRANGRDGVPLYLYYAPRAREPAVLPQILTEGTVLAAIGETS